MCQASGSEREYFQKKGFRTMYCIVNDKHWMKHLIKIWYVKGLERKYVHTVESLIMGEIESR